MRIRVWFLTLLLSCLCLAGQAENLVPNGGFENKLTGWNWQISREAKASVSVAQDVLYRGKAAALFTNDSRMEPHVFGRLECTVPVAPETTYEFSFFVKGNAVDAGTHWTDWDCYLINLPSGTFEWKQINGLITTKPGQKALRLGLNVVNKTAQLWVDEISLQKVASAQKTESAPVSEPLIVIDNMEGTPAWRVQADVKITTEQQIAAVGEQSLRLGLNIKTGGSSWPGVMKDGLNLPLAEKLCFWFYPREVAKFYVRIDDNDGTSADWNLGGPELKLGQWNYIELNLARGHIWGKNQALKNIKSVLFCVYEGWTEFGKAGTYTYFLDEVRLVNGKISDLVITPESDLSGFLYVENDLLTDNEEARFALYVKGSGEVKVQSQLDQEMKTQVLNLDSTQYTNIPYLWNSGALPNGEYKLEVSITNRRNTELARGSIGIVKLSIPGILTQLEQTQAKLTPFAECLERANAKGIDIAYPLSLYTIADNFIDFAKEDIQHGKQERAQEIASYIDDAAARGIAMLKKMSADPAARLQVPRYQTGPVQIQDGVFVQNQRPLFFVGMGHFNQVRKDIPLFPSYGFNIIQIEQGPSGVVLADGSVNMNPIQQLLNVLDNAAANNVKVNLLLSPHYMPQWAFEKYPDLGDEGQGFIKYNINHPAARNIIETYLRTVIPAVRQHPALHSYTLSNEPQYTGKTDQSKLDFQNWLCGKHNSIDRLNSAWGSSYNDFSEINIPADNSDRPLWYEWCVFNQERFTDFHSWMAEIVHELDPQTPVHAKVMANLFNSNTDFATGIDHVAMARLGEVSGNDCWTWYPGSGYAQDWQRQAMYYTFQRSVAPGQPVFNSENHIIRDDHDQYYPGNHIYTALWEGFMQGMGATTIWVWERNESRTLGNNILTRPNCVEAAAKVSLDINRLSEYVHKLQQASTEVAILYSHSAAAWPEYLSEVRRAFEAAYCQGVPLRFVTEDQILSGALASSKILLAPAVTHISEPVFQHIKEYVDQGGILFASGQTGAFDEYSKTRDLGYFWGGRLGQREQIAEPLTIECVATDIFTQQKPILEAQSALQRISPSTAHVLATVESSPVFVVNNWGGGKVYYLATSLATEDYFKLFDLLFEEAEVNRPLRLTTEKGEKVLGIDFKVIEDQEKYYANAVNFTKTDLTVRLQGRKIEKIRDLVTNEVLSQPFELGSLKPRLLEITLAAE